MGFSLDQIGDLHLVSNCTVFTYILNARYQSSGEKISPRENCGGVPGELFNMESTPPVKSYDGERECFHLSAEELKIYLGEVPEHWYMMGSNETE